MGCIYRRGNVYWIKYCKNGKSYAESSHSKKMEVASRLLKKREGEIAEGKMPGICFERVRFDDLVDDYLQDYRVNQKKSLERAECCVNHLKREFEGMKVVEITTSRIKSFIEKRRGDDAANATINRELAALKRMFALASRNTPPKVALVPYIPMLMEQNTRKGFFEYEEYIKVRDILPQYLKPVITFAYYSGWRRSEILNLTWRNVDLKEGVVRLEPGETKNSEARTLYLQAELMELFRQLQRNRVFGCLYVFHKEGHKIKSFRKTWRSACIRAGLCRWDEEKECMVPTKILHDFRRTAIRNMVRAGISERVAMSISGHKTRAVFDRYNIVSKDDLKDAAEKWGRFNELQVRQLHFSYSRPQMTHNEKRVAVVSTTTL